MSGPLFFVKRGDRLIARLKHLLYAWRFAQQANGRVVMVWPGLPTFWHQFDGEDYSPSLIFDLGAMYRDGLSEHLVFLDGDFAFPPDGRTLRGEEFKAMRNNRFVRGTFDEPGQVFYEPSLMHFHFADEVPQRPVLNAELAVLFRRLTLSAEVRRSLDNAKRLLGGERYVALHVRRGDIYEMLHVDLPKILDGSLNEPTFKKLLGHYVTRTAPLEMYLPHVERAIDSGQKIAFFSDSPELIDWFVKRLGRRHFINGATFLAGKPIQKAMLDFTIMVGASQIISTRSNYSGLAADLGNSEHVIVSAQKYTDLTPDEAIALYYDQLVSQFIPSLPRTAPARLDLHQEIRRLYSFVNRLPMGDMT